MAEQYKPKSLDEAVNGIRNHMNPEAQQSPMDFLSKLQLSQSGPVPLEGELAQMQMESLRNQRTAAETTQAQLKAIQDRPEQMDLTPFAMAVDQMTGSKFAQGYKKPEDNEIEKLKLSQLYGQQNQGITDDLVNMQNQGYKREQLALMDKMARNKLAGGSSKPNDYQSAKAKRLGNIAGDYIANDRGQLIANLGKIEGAIALMEQNPGMTGRRFQKVFGSTGAAMYDENLVNTEEAMRSAIQDTMRPTLGAQFTEAEGERIQKLAFNVAVGDVENKRRATELQKMINTKIAFSDALNDYMEENNGSDKGFPYEKYNMRKVGVSNSANILGKDAAKAAAMPSDDEMMNMSIEDINKIGLE